MTSSGKGLKIIMIFILTMGGGFSSALLGRNMIEEATSEEKGQSDEINNYLTDSDSVALVSTPSLLINEVDSVGKDAEERYLHLTEDDFALVAEELDVEVAAIKAVVEIEAGKAMKGFWAPGIPVINFDRTMYNKYTSKAASTEGAKGEKVPEGLKGYALKEWTELINARKVNAQGANMGTFWGMFQIGGFNYKLCGCESVDEFVKRMAYSELEQLQLFAVFITRTGMVESLRKKNWSAFARRYNGPSYAKRGYHTKMAKAYAKYSGS
ncbi:MAG: N-acetylmuramidase family protein [Muribaculaceae bacterium]|nr:N-acetylmuramidase family protein [Muribaculaceae bacterium]